MDGGPSAAQCAVLFAIPVNWEEYDCLARQGSRSDYISGMLAGNDAASIWASDYGRVAGAAQALINTARDLKVGVYQKATLKDFAEATICFQTVILFAHWRGAMFRSSDLLGDLGTILNRMHRHPILARTEPKRRDLDGLVDALNGAVEDLSLLNALPNSIADTGRRSLTVGRTLCRDLIDESLSGLVVPGNRVELMDGLHEPADMERALHSEFSGTLDLALCNSESLATFIDLRRGNRVQHLHWPGVLSPIPQLLKVKKTLQLIAAFGGTYVETRLRLEEVE
jgi:hypothetical protein